jgi:putative ABC transport system permease protein
MIETLWQDFRFGARMLMRKPGFSVVAILILALGIGANAAIFSVLNAVLLQPLPFAEPDKLVVLRATNLRNPGSQLGTSYPDLTDWQEQTRAFEGMAGVVSRSFDMAAEGSMEAERIPGEFVSAGYFSLLRVQPTLGRAFQTADDHLPAGEPVVILSHALWERRFNADPEAVGKSILVNGNLHSVIGVAPKGFDGYSGGAEMWTPITNVDAVLQRYNQIRPARWITAVVGRRSPGFSLPQAQAEMETIALRLEEQYPKANARYSVQLTPLAEQLVGNLEQVILVLFGAVGLVLLIACANVASLLLARATTREREIAIRCALGAGRGRLLRQLMTEALVLSVLGGASGLLIAAWWVDLLPVFFSGIPSFVKIQLDGGVLGFALFLSLLTGVLFGLAPASRLSVVEPVESLKEGGRSAAGHQRRRLQNALVVSELALAVVLLVGAGLFLRTLDQLLSVDLGFQSDRVMTARMVLRDSQYSSGEVVTFTNRLLQSLQELPGVEEASIGLHIPQDGFRAGARLNIEGEQLDDPESGFSVLHHAASAGYFRVLGIPLLQGRAFTAQDTNDAPQVIIVSRSAAQRFWPGEDPLGKRLKFQRANQDTPWLTVVGVVGDARFTGLTGGAGDNLDVYQPMEQSLFYPVRFIAAVVRAKGEPAAVTPAIRQAIQALDPNLPIFAVSTLDRFVANATRQNRTSAGLLSAFSLVALGLAAVGIYGVVSFSVSQRTNEIGIRMAMGAQRQDILKLVIGQGMWLAVLGMGIGLAIAFVVSRLLAKLLFGVSATDPVTFVGVSVVLAAVAALACYVPARRATRVDPMVALRYE